MNSGMWELSDLWSCKDISDHYQVNMPAVSNWIARYSNFPKPIATVAGGTIRLYSKAQIQQWHGAWSRRHS